MSIVSASYQTGVVTHDSRIILLDEEQTNKLSHLSGPDDIQVSDALLAQLLVIVMSGKVLTNTEGQTTLQSGYIVYNSLIRLLKWSPECEKDA